MIRSQSAGCQDHRPVQALAAHTWRDDFKAVINEGPDQGVGTWLGGG